MAQKILVVFGATGNQGRAVLEAFSRRTQQDRWILKGITRNIDSDAARSLMKQDRIQMVAADLDDLESLESALRGATHVFANTDSNRNIAYAAQHPEVLSPVWSSLPSPKKWSAGKYTKVTMFDCKEEIIDMVREDSSLSNKLSVLLIGFYAENPFNVPELYAPHKQPDGTYLLSFPMPGDVEIPFADLSGNVGMWVDALFRAPAGLTMIGASDWHTWDQWINRWAEVNSVNAMYRQTSMADFASRNHGIGEAVAEEFDYVWKFGYAGGNPAAMRPEDLKQFGITVTGTNHGDHMKSVDWSRLL